MLVPSPGSMAAETSSPSHLSSKLSFPLGKHLYIEDLDLAVKSVSYLRPER